VPACNECNTLLNDTLTWSITERRALAKERVQRKHARILATPDRSEEELIEHGHTLQTQLRAYQEQKKHLLLRLSFPDDPFYDQRYLEKSGIENAYASGLLRGE
jgi:hypothetical protein